MNHYPTTLPSSQKGAVLLESLIAILIFSLGVLALAGLQSTMIKNTDDAKYRAEATFIAQQALGEIWVNAQDQVNLADYTVANEPIAQLPNGTRTIAVDANRLVTVTVNWTLPGSLDQHAYTANARIEGIE
jgi:type IV pilus assembly protein PilV